MEAGEEVPDDVLARLLRPQTEGEPNIHDIAICHNILGNITGWIPTITNAFPRAIDELLEREDELQGAQEAARAGDRELVSRYILEASRFNPQNFALLRLWPEKTVIAAASFARPIIVGPATWRRIKRVRARKRARGSARAGSRRAAGRLCRWRIRRW